jgi:hypothetical protein
VGFGRRLPNGVGIRSGAISSSGICVNYFFFFFFFFGACVELVRIWLFEDFRLVNG